MDYLDGALHQSILTALASNLASTSEHDDLALLTDTFSTVEPSTNKQVNGVLDRLTQPASALNGTRGLTSVTVPQVEGMISVAQFAQKSTASTEIVDQVVRLVRSSPLFEIEPALGLAGKCTGQKATAQGFTLSDQLAFELTLAVLSLAQSGAVQRRTALEHISEYQHDILQQIESSEGHRIIGNLLPALNGVRRAIAAAPFVWTKDDPSPAPPRPSGEALGNAGTATADEWDTTTESGRIALATLAQYETSQKGLSSGLIVWCDLEAQRAYWTTVVSSDHPATNKWQFVNHTQAMQIKAGDGALTSRECALGVWQHTLLELEKADSETPFDPYSFDVLLSSLHLGTVSTIAYGQASAELTKILEDLLVHPPSVSDEIVQIGAVECLQALTFAFILSPSPIFEQLAGTGPSLASVAAAKCYAALIDLTGDPAQRESAIQSLLNHFTASERDSTSRGANRKDSDARSIRSVTGGLSESQRATVSANVAHAVGRLVVHFQDQNLARFAAPMLIQRMSGTNPQVDGALMYQLCDIGMFVDKSTFMDIVKAIYDVSKRLEPEDIMTSAVLTAHSRLASTAAQRKDVHLEYLTETLGLFVAKGAHETTSRTKSAKTESLLELIPSIDMFLTQAEFDPRRRDLPSPLLALWRNFWILCRLAGFLSTPVRIYEWQRQALQRIAVRSPALLRGAGNDFVETELQYNAILKSEMHALSPDTVRTELASALPSQATNARSLPSNQVVFLATVLGLESLRAEAGRPSAVFSYFHNEGVNSHTSMYDMLSSIAEQVNSRFMGHLSDRVVSHSMDEGVYPEIREIIIECAHQYAKNRTVATRYLNDLFSSFPSLLCNSQVVTTLLELLTLLRRACLSEYTDEYTPTFNYHSERGKFSITLSDDYTARNRILTEMHRFTKAWLKTGITRAPLEMRGLLQDYVKDPIEAEFHSAAFADDEMGKSVALDILRMSTTNAKEGKLFSNADDSANFVRSFSAKNYFGGQLARTAEVDQTSLLAELEDLSEQVDKHKLKMSLPEMRKLFYRAAGHLVNAPEPDVEILDLLVSLPVRIFTEGAMSLAVEVWTWIAEDRPELEARLMIEAVQAWTGTIHARQGLFSDTINRANPLNQETQFTPTDKDRMTKEYLLANRLLQPHGTFLSFLSSRYQAFRYRSIDLVHACLLLVIRSVRAHKLWSTHQLTRELRMKLVSFGFCVLQGSRLETAVEFNLRNKLYDAALSWFATPPGWSYGSNRVQLKADLVAMEELASTVKSDVPTYDLMLTSTLDRTGQLPGRVALKSATALHTQRVQLLGALLENEMDRLKLWLNPLMDAKHGPVPSKVAPSESTWKQHVRVAWHQWPDVAVQIPARIKSSGVATEVTRLVKSHPERVQHNPDALSFFVGDGITSDVKPHLRHLLYWAPVPVIMALRFLFPKFKGDPVLLQYALRTLEHHPVDLTFFYIPQVVQALRTDELGYAERFIFETSQISQLFCHQIIWNMKANAYRGDDGEEPDPMKPTLDRMVDMIVGALSGDAKDFYQREFAFFDEVTSISAKLKPYIKAPKPEKKAKIDEEMAKIKVDPGVYLPSNPDGVVVDINRTSGRPLQSHAKAPFMATFKVRREHKKGADPADLEAQDALLEHNEQKQAIDGEGADKPGDAQQEPGTKTYDTWQSAIFKVGDDCRQDVLALQIIAMHKNIFTSLGLDLLVTPYKVTATGPGCGVIDVVPDATSRDEMGRAKINDLKSFFQIKYGSPDSIEFQRARTNFVQSMAAYSLLCYLVQIKDRHNGNIMIDGRGCITHIGGVKFEPSSFKLTHEMIVLMGGKDSVGFKHFQELTIKSFLAARPFAQAVVETSAQMAGAGFPSYKDEHTMDRLLDRFKPDLSEVEAAEYMKGIINNALENMRSIVYDEFQRMTNGIPYVR
ncbi:phosphatidylinositol-4- kinase [Microbotryomycetes sp. JL201]|nr:phosphatidylinositol-4- kinase [Microbotryomycetes sp. JL201]